MKFTIEIEQAGPKAVPVIKIMVDGKIISMVQRLEFEAKTDAKSGAVVPQALIRFPDVGKLDTKTFGGDDGALMAIKSSLSHHRKLLSNFPWIDVP